MLTVGVIGAGRVGSAVARAAVGAGHRVRVAGSGTPDELALVARFAMPGAEAVSAHEAASGVDLVIVAVPLKRFREIDSSMLVGHVVVDVMNYWEPLDGFVPGFSDVNAPTSEIVQRSLPGASVVKTLNHIGYHELESDARPAGASDRRALAIASDDEEAAALVAGFVDSLGFDAVFAGRLRDSAVMQPGTPVFDGRLDAALTIDAVLASRNASLVAAPSEL
jgi:predicted dinucleotide-binding enzyme